MSQGTCEKCNKAEGLSYRFYYGKMPGRDVRRAEFNNLLQEQPKYGPTRHRDTLLCDRCVKKVRWLTLTFGDKQVMGEKAAAHFYFDKELRSQGYDRYWLAKKYESSTEGLKERETRLTESECSLLETASSHQVSTLRELIEAGVNVNVKDSDGTTPLIAAAQAYRLDMVSFGYAPLRKAVLDGSSLRPERMEQRKTVQETLQLLMKAGADLNAVTEDGWTALSLSAKNNYIDSLRALVERGADVNLNNQAGRTALMAAVVAGSVESVEALIEAGADVNSKDARGLTAMDYANELFKAAGFTTM